MGLLIDGKWHDQWYDTEASGGEFVREEAVFRHWISADGQPVAGLGDADTRWYPAQSGRYHLYVSLACPWAHRTLIFRALKGLVPHIDVSVVHPHMLENGWEFAQSAEFSMQGTGDRLFGLRYLHQLYTRAQSDFTGRVTVPVLWDKQSGTIVSNESSEIIRMFNSAFDDISGNSDDYWPQALRLAIEEVNQKVYQGVNNGVYRAGFATTQQAYEKAVDKLFASLDWIEQRLQSGRYLLGERLTEADWRLFTTLVRFDAVYFGHFKCNIRRIEDYPATRQYLRELYQYSGVAETVDFYHIKQHYYFSHTTINPTQVVPVGPDLDFTRPHDRGQRFSS